MMLNLDVMPETPKMTDKEQTALSSELISELLTGMRLRGVQYRRIQTGPSFGLGFDDRPGHAYFHYLAAGTAFLRTNDGALHQLTAGNAVFMPQGGAHQLLSDPRAVFQPIDNFATAPLGEAVSGVDTCPSTHPIPSAVLFYGCMAFDFGGMHRLGKLMPQVIVANTDQPRYPGLVSILYAMKSEICSGRIGFAGILARLAEVAAAMMVRGWVECGCESASGLFCGPAGPAPCPGHTGYTPSARQRVDCC